MIVNEELGGYLAARHLLDQGAQCLAFMGVPLTVRAIAQCLEARTARSQSLRSPVQAHKKPGLNLADGRDAGPLLMATSRSPACDNNHFGTESNVPVSTSANRPRQG